MDTCVLVIGNKVYSSWSLRPWLALRMAGVPFEEVVVPLRRKDTADTIARHSPSGKVPVLKCGDVVIWDSLAILEYVAELAPAAGLWPADAISRAVARSVSAEMHSGFMPLRTHMSMNLNAALPGQGRTQEVEADIRRITTVWRQCRERFGGGGPFLFGAFTNADAMYAPVVTRFLTYGVDLDPVCRAYADAVLALPPMVEWYAAAKAEPATLPQPDAA